MIRPVSLLLAAALWAAGLRAQDRPDVVLIVMDDVGLGDVGYLGSEIRTPHLDRLAAEGVVFDRYYTAPSCSPARAGLLTGRHGIRMGIATPITWADTLGLPAQERTLAEALQAAGYATAAVGKWHLGRTCAHHPLVHGFDTFVGVLSGEADYFTRQTRLGPDWWRERELEAVEGYTTDLIADEAVALLEQPRERPFFVYLPFTASHRPTQARPEDRARYPDLEEPRRTFAAMTTRLDDGIGRVMEAVRASGRPTVVWVVSDNGAKPELGGSNGPLRGIKGQVEEGGIRVPGLVWFSDGRPPARPTHPVWYLDVAPTVLGLVAGAPPPNLPFDGVDQGPALAGEGPPAALRERVLVSYRYAGHRGYQVAAQTATWKYVERQRGRLPDAPQMALYRIGSDPYETADSLRWYPEIAAALRDTARATLRLRPPAFAGDSTLRERWAPDLTACGGVAVNWVPDDADHSGGLAGRVRTAVRRHAALVAGGGLAVLLAGLALGWRVRRRSRGASGG